MIETDRLHLLPWKDEDWAGFAPIAQDPEVMRFITRGEPWSEERIKQFVSKQQMLYKEQGFCRWRLELKSTGETVGFCGAGNVHGLDEWELGWWIARRYWGQGLAPEAARAALEHFFRMTGLPRVLSVIAIGNTASERVAEKLGYRPIGERELMGFQVRVYERLRS